MLEELVEHDLRLAAALQFNHDAHSIAIGFITNVADIFDGLVVDQFGDALDQVPLVHLIGNFRNDDGLAVLCEILNRRFGAHHETSTPVLVGLKNSSFPMNDAVGGEVRSLNDLQHFRQHSLRIVDQHDGRIHDFCQIVRRDIGRHSDRNPVRSIDQQVGNASG